MIKNHIEISVIIPTYNRLPMLKEALTSVFSQDYQGNIEVIVVDDNSQDGTSKFILQEYPNIHLISLEQNVGCPTARNLGISQAKGQYIAFLDSDDLWETNYLSSQILALEGKERCFCVSHLVSWYVMNNRKKVEIQKPDLKTYTSPIHHLLIETFILTPSSVIFPIEIFYKVGFFDENLKLGSDTDLYIRCLLKGYSPLFSEQFSVIRRVHNEGQMTDAKNLRSRKKSRIDRIHKFYPLLDENHKTVSLNRIYAELNTNFASLFFRRKYFVDWLVCSVLSAYYSSPQYALNNMRLDFAQTKAFKRIQKKLKVEQNPQT
ncbi:glycosyltransferase family 2 protein [Limnoraphis robusta]|uniref:glycosyltransferase family 2 protein n=1 Tax=Limnoraphis robusta TaxID=1118279 RepID=UPI00066C7584|nr:glycosyltransferase family 2 protein [Limnoraphis robusta]